MKRKEVSCAANDSLLFSDVSSADYLCKQFGPRSGPTERRS